MRMSKKGWREEDFVPVLQDAREEGESGRLLRTGVEEKNSFSDEAVDSDGDSVVEWQPKATTPRKGAVFPPTMAKKAFSLESSSNSGGIMVVESVGSEGLASLPVAALMDDEEQVSAKLRKKENSPVKRTAKRAQKALPSSRSTRRAAHAPTSRDAETERALRREEKLHFRRAAAALQPARRKRAVSAGESGPQESRDVPLEPSPPPSLPVEESLYQRARRALQVRDVLVGRVVEGERVGAFLAERLASTPPRGGGLYLSGPPGVGKSLTVAATAQRLLGTPPDAAAAAAASRPRVRRAVVNLAAENVPCLLSHVARLVVGKNSRLLTERDVPLDRVSARGMLEDYCRRKQVLLVVEEADHKAHVKAVCELFELARLPESRLVVVGLGNGRNFVAKNKLHAEEMVFAAYSADELMAIVSSKLGPELFSELVDASALKLWASKVVENMGDCRSAISSLVKAIDWAEAEHLKLPPPRQTVKVGLRAVKALVDGWGSSKESLGLIAGLAPSARVLLMGLARETSGGSGRFSAADVRRVYAALFKSRPDEGQLRSLLGSLLDTPFLVADDSGNYLARKLEPAVVEQAVSADPQLQAFLR